jgi:hypothetical protein
VAKAPFHAVDPKDPDLIYSSTFYGRLTQQQGLQGFIQPEKIYSRKKLMMKKSIVASGSPILCYRP